MIELSLAIGKAPVVRFEDLELCIQKDKLGLKDSSAPKITIIKTGDSKAVIADNSGKSNNYKKEVLVDLPNHDIETFGILEEDYAIA
jgi:hypothetical protein